MLRNVKVYKRAKDIDDAVALVQSNPNAIYIGGGAWLPGLPAKNLTAEQADAHYDALVENMAGPRPIYRRRSEPTPEPAQDQQQQQSEPEDLPAKPTRRTQRRKEK